MIAKPTKNPHEACPINTGAVALQFALAILTCTTVLLLSPSMAAAQLQDVAPVPSSEAPAVDEWNPMKALKSIEVGRYYLKTGRYDAAIDRFEEATRYQPNLAEPYFQLGKTYEKKKELDKAIASYQKYLELYRTAPNREDVEKLISKLTKQAEKERAKRSDARS
jgi:tetratricopeptide (TPR) repeat protein